MAITGWYCGTAFIALLQALRIEGLAKSANEDLDIRRACSSAMNAVPQYHPVIAIRKRVPPRDRMSRIIASATSSIPGRHHHNPPSAIISVPASSTSISTSKRVVRSDPMGSCRWGGSDWTQPMRSRARDAGNAESSIPGRHHHNPPSAIISVPASSTSISTSNTRRIMRVIECPALCEPRMMRRVLLVDMLVEEAGTEMIAEQ
jgi:hypothetical protein